MRLRIWAFVSLLPILVLAQQRALPTPPQFQQQRFNRDQLNGLSSSEESSLALPQPPLFMTSPSFSFDEVPPATTTSTDQLLTLSPATSLRQSTRPARRRPFVRPVVSVQLQKFRPTPRSSLQLPVRPRFRTSTTSQLRPATQPPLRRIQLNTQNQARPRAPQPQPATTPRRPATAPPIRVQPASVPAQTPVRRPTPPLQIRPLTQPAAPRAQPFNRAPNRLPTAFTPGVRNRPTVPRPTQPLAPPQTALRSTASTALRRPVSQSTPSFTSTNSIGPAGPPTTGRFAIRPPTPLNAHPPGNLPPSNSVVDELNRADDFMAVAARLKLRRFVRHRNRRRADFILQQQLKNR